MALNFGVLSLIVTWADVYSHVFYSPYSVEANSAAVSHDALFLMAYAAVMLWLGWRKLARFQATGAMAGDDLVTAGPDFMPSAVAEWFRSRSSGTVLNLIRKEFRLLRPVWLLTVLMVVGWSGVTAFQVMREREHVKFMPITAGGVGIAGALLLAVLAGCLSLGDERISGRHSWHLTLPVSARVQWLVKFLTALFAGAICAGVVPLLLLAAGKNLLGMSVLVDKPDYPTLWFWSMLTITAAAFWCSCATDGTVTAALWVVPVLAAILFAPQAGIWGARWFTHLLEAKFNLYGNLRFDDTVSHALFWSPRRRTFFQSCIRSVVQALQVYAWDNPYDFAARYGSSYRLITLIPAAVLGVWQSYRMFQKQAIAGARVVVRRLLPLVLLTLACSFAASAIVRATTDAAGHPFTTVRTIHSAIENFLAGSGSPTIGVPMELRAKDLDDAYPLPKDILKSLHNARITVVPEGPTSESYRKKLMGSPWQAWWYYHATIQLEDGTVLTIAFRQNGAWQWRIYRPGEPRIEPVGNR